MQTADHQGAAVTMVLPWSYHAGARYQSSHSIARRLMHDYSWMLTGCIVTCVLAILTTGLCDVTCGYSLDLMQMCSPIGKL